MSTATLQGRTPRQLAGANSQPVAVRNISATAPVYIGFEASIQPETADMVVLAGELFNSPADQPLWACTDTGLAASVIYNTSGTGVQLSGPTSVAINNKPPVTIPDGVAINGDVNVKGSVAVSGNVGIAGSVAIAGDVNVLGTIKSRAQYTTNTLINNAQFGFYNETRVLFDNVDVSSYESISFRLDCTQNHVDPNYSSTGTIALFLVWKDANGNYISGDYQGNGESAVCWYNGLMEWTVKVRGALVGISAISYGLPYTIYPYLTVMGFTQQTAPSYRHAFRDQQYANAGGVYIHDGNLSAGLGKIIGATVDINQSGYVILGVTSFSGKGQIGIYNTGYAQCLLRFVGHGASMFNQQEQVALTQLNASAQSVFTAPRAPMFVHVGLQSNTSGTSKFSIAWD